MAETQLVLQCPYCKCDFAVKPPDDWHTDYSFTVPALSNGYRIIKKRQVTCENPECGRTVTVYWSSPIEYFNVS